MEKEIYDSYLNILKEELLPAMGCTEPIAVAYAAALAKEALGCLPEVVEICVSGNILKNVKSVVVPSTGGLRGVASAAAAGIAAGDPAKKLEVLAGIAEADHDKIKAFSESAKFIVRHSDSGCIFDIGVRVFSGENE
ncbi:MAG: serine dehydratase subunit alpha family protein, partial [Candidatus Coproplasma sp.]